jgi:hypothetical protein
MFISIKIVVQLLAVLFWMEVLGMSKSSRILLCFLVGYNWHVLLSEKDQILSIMGASLFGCVEYTWTKITSGKGNTTWYQFACNVAYVPYLLLDCRQFLCGYSAPISFMGFEVNPSAVVLFPFSIYTLELVQGYALIYLFGENRAWHYKGPMAFFHGNINLAYFFVWMGFGAAIELALPFLFQKRDQLVVFLNHFELQPYMVILIMASAGVLIERSLAPKSCH